MMTKCVPPAPQLAPTPRDTTRTVTPRRRRHTAVSMVGANRVGRKGKNEFFRRVCVVVFVSACPTLSLSL